MNPFELIILILFIGLPLYFLPSLSAWRRGHPQLLGIFLLNLFLGWTFLGWVGALVWSVVMPEPVSDRRHG